MATLVAAVAGVDGTAMEAEAAVVTEVAAMEVADMEAAEASDFRDCVPWLSTHVLGYHSGTMTPACSFIQDLVDQSWASCCGQN